VLAPAKTGMAVRAPPAVPRRVPAVLNLGGRNTSTAAWWRGGRGHRPRPGGHSYAWTFRPGPGAENPVSFEVLLQTFALHGTRDWWRPNCRWRTCHQPAVDRLTAPLSQSQATWRALEGERGTVEQLPKLRAKITALSGRGGPQVRVRLPPQRPACRSKISARAVEGVSAVTRSHASVRTTGPGPGGVNEAGRREGGCRRGRRAGWWC